MNPFKAVTIGIFSHIADCRHILVVCIEHGVGLGYEIRLERKSVKIDDLWVDCYIFWFINIVNEFEQSEKILYFNRLDAYFIISPVVALEFKGKVLAAKRLQ